MSAYSAENVHRSGYTRHSFFSVVPQVSRINCFIRYIVLFYIVHWQQNRQTGRHITGSDESMLQIYPCYRLLNEPHIKSTSGLDKGLLVYFRTLRNSGPQKPAKQRDMKTWNPSYWLPLPSRHVLFPAKAAIKKKEEPVAKEPKIKEEVIAYRVDSLIMVSYPAYDENIEAANVPVYWWYMNGGVWMTM